MKLAQDLMRSLVQKALIARCAFFVCVFFFGVKQLKLAQDLVRCMSFFYVFAIFKGIYLKVLYGSVKALLRLC
jgi:hypothetical protein